MRIIAGEFRGRKLLLPRGQITRPITDRVKQSLFDIVSPLLPDAHVYDCFAGTGSLGLEALSRGAAFVTFFEADRSGVELLKRNIAALEVEDRCRVAAGDVFKWFAAGTGPPRRIDLIFLDPPYRFLRERADELRRLVAQMTTHYLSPSGTIVFRHDVADQLSFDSLARYDQRDYGGMTLEFLGSVETEGPALQDIDDRD